jgi:CBS domain containing-hemolysin-like protein
VSPTLGLVVVVVLITANGFFVAAEFAFVAVRREAVEALAAEGSRRARIALEVLKNLSFVLSGAQFGITATSLLVGFLAEDSVGALLRPIADGVGLPESTALAVSVTGAFFLSTVFQMILGELAPKNLAIARPETVALAVARLVRLYGTVFGPLIRVFDGAAEKVSRRLGVEPQHELLGGASLTELSRIIAVSGEEGSLSEDQAGLLSRAVELGNRRAHEIMIPRPDVVWLDRQDSVAELRAASRRSGHSRFPVKDVSEDEVVGSVHIKDLLTLPPDRRATATIDDLVAPVLFVPESEPLRRLLGAFRHASRTFAIVIDEYGGTAGIVTIEDLIEELVGEIEDEFDRDVAGLRRIGAGRYIVSGMFRADRLQTDLGIDVPDGEFETVAGFCIAWLGRIPEPGEAFEHDGWRFTITEREGKRVSQIRLDRQTLPGWEGPA